MALSTGLRYACRASVVRIWRAQGTAGSAVGVPTDGGTRLRLDVGLFARLPNAVRRRLCRTFAERELRGDLASLEQAILEAA